MDTLKRLQDAAIHYHKELDSYDWRSDTATEYLTRAIQELKDAAIEYANTMREIPIEEN